MLALQTSGPVKLFEMTLIDLRLQLSKAAAGASCYSKLKAKVWKTFPIVLLANVDTFLNFKQHLPQDIPPLSQALTKGTPAHIS